MTSTATRFNASTAGIVDAKPGQFEMFGKEVFVGRHRLEEWLPVGDEALISLIEHHPRERLQIFCSGTDPRRFREDWHLVDAGDATPAAILTAVAKGRLWVNLRRFDLSDEFGSIVKEIYAALERRSPGLRPFGIQASLFISSPNAVVYYHADASPNLLWHLRGSKRIWIYPAQDVRLVPQALLEDIFAGAVDEVPYFQGFDLSAKVLDLHPGEVVSWPQNSPHRVQNLHGINVSLTTMHWTRASDRRRSIYLSNRYYRRVLKLPAHSVTEQGLVADIKCLAYRLSNRLHLVPEQIATSDARYSDRGRASPRFLIDETAPLGVRST